jgi:hypothetical protein
VSTEALARVVAFYESISPSDIAGLGELYAADACFKDPFNEVRGVPALRYFAEKSWKRPLAEMEREVEERVGERIRALTRLEWPFALEGEHGVERADGARRTSRQRRMCRQKRARARDRCTRRLRRAGRTRPLARTRHADHGVSNRHRGSTDMLR